MDQIELLLIRSRISGLYVALSEQLPELFVTGRTIEEVEARAPTSVQALLAAAGRATAPVRLNIVRLLT
jgi:hypothetical protein